MTPEDWPAVRRIYAEGLATGKASFETEVPGWPAWNADHLPGCRLIAEGNGEVADWAALMSVSARECYRGVAEASVYVKESGLSGRRSTPRTSPACNMERRSAIVGV